MLITWLVLILPLCIDSFLVATAVGMSKPSFKERLRLSLLFALFEGGMPLVGLFVGHGAGQLFGSVSEYLALAVLIGFGIVTYFSKEEEEIENARKLSSVRGFGLVLVGLGMSIDELAVGLSFGLLKLSIILAAVLIALQAIIASQIGFAIGSKLTEQWRDRGEKLASLAFITIGLVLLSERVL